MSKMLETWKKLFTRKSRRRRMTRQERIRIIVSLIALLIAILMLLGIFLPAFMVSGLSSDSVTARYRTAHVELGNIQRDANANPRIVWLKEEGYNFPFEGAYVEEAFVREGDYVQEGDALISFTRQVPYARRARLELEQERLLTRQATELDTLTARIEALKISEDGSSDQGRELERLQIRLVRMELDHEDAVKQSQDEINNLIALNEADTLHAQMDGIVVNVAGFRQGELVQQDQHLITIRDPQAAYLSVDNTNNAFRYGEDITMTYGFANDPKYIDAHVIISPELSELRTNDSSIYLEVKEDDLRAAAVANDKDPDTFSLEDLKNVRISTYSTDLQNVLIVPKNAVSQSAGKHYVYILEDDVLRRRYFQPGVDDLSNMQVVSGLEAGQTIVIR